MDSGDASWAEPYRVELRISTNPSPGAGSNSATTSSEGPLQAQAIDNRWIEVSRGREFERWRNPATGELKQVIYPGPTYTWDGSSWVPYVLENLGDYLQVKHPRASARMDFKAGG